MVEARRCGGASLLVDGSRAVSALHAQAKLITKPIPTTGEQLPVIGLGSAGTFNFVPQGTAWTEARKFSSCSTRSAAR
jgi:hypothetical protein